MILLDSPAAWILLATKSSLEHSRSGDLQEVTLAAAPTCVSHFSMAHDAFNQHPTRKEVMFGLANGDIGQIFLDSATYHPGTILETSGHKGAVTQLFSEFDMTQNGMNEIAVGREDGSFEVYDMQANGQLQLVRLSK
jgi:hypothetical protein